MQPEWVFVTTRYRRGLGVAMSIPTVYMSADERGGNRDLASSNVSDGKYCYHCVFCLFESSRLSEDEGAIVMACLSCLCNTG